MPYRKDLRTSIATNNSQQKKAANKSAIANIGNQNAKIVAAPPQRDAFSPGEVGHDAYGRALQEYKATGSYTIDVSKPKPTKIDIPGGEIGKDIGTDTKKDQNNIPEKQSQQDSTDVTTPPQTLFTGVREKTPAQIAISNYQQATKDSLITDKIKEKYVNALATPTSALQYYQNLSTAKGLPEQQKTIQALSQQAKDISNQIDDLETTLVSAASETDITRSQLSRRVAYEKAPLRKQLADILSGVKGLQEVYDSSLKDVQFQVGLLQEDEKVELANLEKELEVMGVSKEEKKIARDLFNHELEMIRAEQRYNYEDFKSHKDFVEAVQLEKIKAEFRLAETEKDQRDKLNQLLFKAGLDQDKWYLDNFGTTEPTHEEIDSYRQYLNAVNKLDLAKRQADINRKNRTGSGTQKPGTAPGTIKVLTDEYEQSPNKGMYLSELSASQQDAVIAEYDRRLAAEENVIGDKGPMPIQ